MFCMYDSIHFTSCKQFDRFQLPESGNGSRALGYYKQADHHWRIRVDFIVRAVANGTCALCPLRRTAVMAPDVNKQDDKQASIRWQGHLKFHHSRYAKQCALNEYPASRCGRGPAKVAYRRRTTTRRDDNDAGRSFERLFFVLYMRCAGMCILCAWWRPAQALCDLRSRLKLSVLYLKTVLLWLCFC